MKWIVLENGVPQRHAGNRLFDALTIDGGSRAPSGRVAHGATVFADLSAARRAIRDEMVFWHMAERGSPRADPNHYTLARIDA